MPKGGALFHINDYDQSLQNTPNLIFLRENIYLPFIRFLYRKSLFTNVFDQNFFICHPIFTFFFFAAHCCDKLNVQLCQENISSTFKQLQNICEKPDTSKHTIVLKIKQSKNEGMELLYDNG